jgi:hypothetical protein
MMTTRLGDHAAATRTHARPAMLAFGELIDRNVTILT